MDLMTLILLLELLFVLVNQAENFFDTFVLRQHSINHKFQKSFAFVFKILKFRSNFDIDEIFRRVPTYSGIETFFQNI